MPHPYPSGVSAVRALPLRAVFFDFDGTLWDPEPHIFHAYAEVFHRHGQVLTGSTWSTVVGTVGFDLWSELERLTGGRVDREAADAVVSRSTEERLAGLGSRPGVRRWLAELDRSGLARALVSNSRRPWIARYLRQCGIERGWQAIHSSEGKPDRAKPAPHLYQEALDRLGLRPDEAMAFEDSPSGITAAKRAGLRCVAVPNAMTAGLDLSEADLTLASFAHTDLPQLLHSMGLRARSGPPRPHGSRERRAMRGADSREAGRGIPEHRQGAPRMTVLPSANSCGEDVDDVLRHYYNPPHPLKAARGEGVYLCADDGTRYLDCSSGTFNLTLGYSHPEIVEAVRAQAGELIHVTSKFQSGPVNELVSRLAEIAPDGLSRVHLKSSSGSDANEGAIKIAQHHTGNPDVVSLFRAHLGQTMGMIGASGAAFRRAPFPSQIPGVVHVPDPYCARCFYRQERATCGLLCAERINDFIDYASSGRVACVVVEPISGNGGNIVAPDGYLQALRDLCDERGILLVFDEIQTGFGRTGQMFAADTFGVTPDLLTFGKGLGGSGLPIAGILAQERLTGLEGHHISSTFGANVLAAAAAVKTIEILRRPGFLENVRAVGAHVMSRLRELATQVPFMGDVRGEGLMIGVEIVDSDGEPDPALTNHLAERGMQHGLLLRTSLYGFGNVVKVRPPLIMTTEEADDMCDRLGRLFLDAS